MKLHLQAASVFSSTILMNFRGFYVAYSDDEQSVEGDLVGFDYDENGRLQLHVAKYADELMTDLVQPPVVCEIGKNWASATMTVF